MGLISGLEENSQHGSRLMSLPDELILSVIEQIDDSKSLRNFILTCQKAQNRAEPYLYRNLVFRNGEDVVRFLNALKYMPKRGDYAQLLDVRYKVAHRHGIRLLDGKLGRLANLRSWRIESPCPNDNMAFSFTGEFGTGEGVLHYWDDLPKLKHLHSIHIHTHVRGKTYFDLCNGRGATIFKSASLQNIHLACADITVDSVRLLEDCTDKTPLETLVFEECNIDAKALKTILSLPKALKHLTLGERLHHFHEPTSKYLPESGPGLAEALALQAPSLEYLKQTQLLSRVLLHWNNLPVSERRRIFSLPQELPEFPALRELDIPYGSPLQGIAAKQPPKLEKVRIHHVHEHLPNTLLDYLPRELKLLDQTSVKDLEIVLMEVRTTREDTQEQWLDTLVGPGSTRCIWIHEQKRMLVWDFGRKLRKNDIRLTVNWIRSAGYIPPYMHGEILPTEFTIYDSNSPDLFGHIPSSNYMRDAACEDRLKQGRGAAEAPADPASDDGFEDDGEVYAFM